MIRTIMSHPRTRQAGALGALAAALLLAPTAQADTNSSVAAATQVMERIRRLRAQCSLGIR